MSRVSPQGLVVCQVKLSNGLMVHGPQCQSESDAKENAAFFALQRLVQHTHIPQIIAAGQEIKQH